MPNWTKEQLDAINISGKNIIVSAGAGSGKTAVLTERVITKIKNGTNITNLLILTFTNAAAVEMKNRIRKALEKEENLKEQLDYIDSAYITTFDSFSMSIIRKYHYLLNISPKISILEKSICDNVRNIIIDEIFEQKYKNEDEDFLKLINDLTIKDDTEIKKSIIDINNKLDRLINKEEYLKNYIETYYKDQNINFLIEKFKNLVIEKVKKTENLLYDLSFLVDEKYYNEMNNALISILNFKSYDELKSSLQVRLPSIPRGSEEEAKTIKEKISKIIKYLNSILIYKDESHLKSTILMTKNYAKAVIDIVLKLDERLNEYKCLNDTYEYNDIAKYAIKLVKTHAEVKKELQDSFEEIMVDEYQDTSDIQEELITLISNNNLYMVGDVKQSIYRFRNANPDIFKSKYDKYSKKIEGIKIDLLNNFRSREEVLFDINNIFNLVMDDTIGGANYKEFHQMNFGNTNYVINHPKQNFNLEIFNYQKDNKKYKSSEYEAFIIANDIKNKINTGYEVLDKETGCLRKVGYEDFAILLDRKANFELYKKIFEYLGVPLVIYYDEKITNEKDVLIIKNIIDLIIRIHKKTFDTKFKYDFYSISRSYLSNINDEEYIKRYNSNEFKDSDIYIKCSNISSKLDGLSNKKLIEEIVKEFNFYENAIKVGEIEKSIIRIDYLKKLGESLTDLGYSPIEFNEYLENMILMDSDITFSLNTKVSNNVKLMNIHKSKGLEFPICYFAGYENKFNRTDLNNRINFDKELGFILPFYDNGIGNIVVKEIFKAKYNDEDVSERIRLFYVALTRAKEKMIIVANLSDKADDIDEEVKRGYISFLTIIESIQKYLKSNIVLLNDIKLTKDYNIGVNKDLNIEISNEKIILKEINVENSLIETKGASKNINKLINENEYETIKYGTKMHRFLEVSDFNNSEQIIQNFVSNFKDINAATVYKEYEFITEIDDKEYHGVIDLMLEYNDHIKIIDYKLKNIEDEAYKNQLNIYKKYVEEKTNKEVKIYLYSILDNIIKEL